jgi:hypothetical protein
MNCDICKSRKAKICIQIWAFSGGGADTFYLCKRCANMFADLLYNPKKMLERTVRPDQGFHQFEEYY